MREITYMGWDKEQRFLFIVGGLGFQDGDLTLIEAPIRQESDEYDAFPIKGYELLEYTGLVDGWNNMIFEGSIVRLDSDEFWRVAYEAGQFVLQSRDGTIQRSLALYADDPKLRVIGNVYEDSDLFPTEKS